MDDIPLLTCDQLVRRSSVSKSTIYRLVKLHRLPYYQPAGKGGKLLFPPDAIERAATASIDFEKPAKEKPQSGRPPVWTTYMEL